MLNFVTRELATHYFLLAFLSILGILQLVAARHKLIGLSLWGSRNPAPGYLLGAVLTAGGFVWFFAATPEVFIPGLAGSELAILFGAAGICALAFTLLASSILHGIQHRERSDLKADARLHHEAIAWQQLRGTLYLPKDAAPLTEDAASLKGEPRAAICVLPSPSERTLSPHPIVANLVNEGFIVLAIDWGPDEEIRYPAILGLLPGAVAYLMRRDDVNPERIGVLGVDLGGDLAIRSAGTDPQIAAVLALAPFLDQANTQPGLNILKETSYLGAICWARPLRLHRKRGKLVAELAPLDYVSRLGSRPLLLVYGDQDGITPVAQARAALSEETARGKLKSLPGNGHLSLPRSRAASALVTRWFKENL
jgi:fermentation-respiration switch protein FrsA (DUF1100 family)